MSESPSERGGGVISVSKYERIWTRGLTTSMRLQLIHVAQHEGEQIAPVHGSSAKALRYRGYITEYPYRLTEEGRNLLNANTAVMVETTPDALTDAQAQIAALTAERDAARAALQEIASRGADERPAEPLMDFKSQREEDMVRDYIVWGKELGGWIMAEVARKALSAAEALRKGAGNGA